MVILWQRSEMLHHETSGENGIGGSSLHVDVTTVKILGFWEVALCRWVSGSSLLTSVAWCCAELRAEQRRR